MDAHMKSTQMCQKEGNYIRSLKFSLMHNWNSYPNIPGPPNLMPNLPCQPSPYVPTLPNSHSLSTHKHTHTQSGEGLKEKGGESPCFCAFLNSFSVRGNKKLRGSGWLSNLVGHPREAHYWTLVSTDSGGHCCGINSVSTWVATDRRPLPSSRPPRMCRAIWS